MSERGILLREGTLVDATIIAAPSSTKNKKKERDPEMHQTRKGKQWYFGMKAHVGVDADSGVVHTLTGTAANVADISETHRLLHGREKRGQGDSGYTGVEKRVEILTRFPHIQWQVAAQTRQAQGHGGRSPQGSRQSPGEMQRRNCAPTSSIPFMSSKTSFVIARCVIEVWPRTRRNSTRSLPWPTWSSPNLP